MDTSTVKVKAKEKKQDNGKGEGHKARIAVVAKCKVEIDGKVTAFNVDYDVTVTYESLDYIVRQIAGGIAQAADRIAKDGLTSPRSAKVSKN